MNRFIKGTLAIQFAIAGVALAQDNERNAPGIAGMMGVNEKAPVGTVRASTLIGAEVYNDAGKHLGEIKDIVLDKDSKRVGYAVLSYGGIAGMGDKLFAMPHKMLRYTEAENRAYVSLEENVLKNAPGFDQSKWPTEANADYYRKLDSYYHDQTQRRAEESKREVDQAADATKHEIDQSAKTAGDRLDEGADKSADALKDSSKEAGRDLKQAGDRAEDRLDDAADGTEARLSKDHDVTAQPAAGTVGRDHETLTWNRRVSSVIGANVENTTGENLGEVQDLVIDWTKGEVRYAVLSYGGVLGIGDKLFAVPMNVFQSQQDDSKLVLNVSKDQLKNAPGFNKDQWPNMADPQWSKQVSDFYHQDRAD